MPVEPKSPDPTLDVLEYVRKRESEGGHFLGVSGRGGSDLSILHSDGVAERDGIEERTGLETETGDSGLGLSGVAGKGSDSEDVDVVLLRPLKPLPLPTPAPTPLELDPSLLRNTARVGVTPSSLMNSSSKCTPPSLASILAHVLDIRPLKGRLLLSLTRRPSVPRVGRLLRATRPNSSTPRSSSPSSSRRTE